MLRLSEEVRILCESGGIYALPVLSGSTVSVWLNFRGKLKNLECI